MSREQAANGSGNIGPASLPEHDPPQKEAGMRVYAGFFHIIRLGSLSHFIHGLGKAGNLP